MDTKKSCTLDWTTLLEILLVRRPKDRACWHQDFVSNS